MKETDDMDDEAKLIEDALALFNSPGDSVEQYVLEPNARVVMD